MTEIVAGQVWRSTDGDGRVIPASMGGGTYRNDRRVRVVEREPDGRWLIQTIGGNERRSRVKEQTLRSTYELLPLPRITGRDGL